MARRSSAFGIVALAVLVACGREEARSDPDRRTNDLRTRTAANPVPPAPGSATAELRDPLAGICLAGDPDRGDPWRIGGLDSVATFAIDSIERSAPRDSARLVARLARTVDALPSDTGIVDFRGLPVVVTAAWRIVLAPGDTIIVASVARRVPIESAPLEERFTLVAVPVVVPTIRDALHAAWHLREVGPEETLVAREPVVAWLGVEGPRLLLAAAGEGSPLVELLVRDDGLWRTAWSGGIERCAPR